MEDPVLFALAVLAVLGTPGPTNTLLATAGATAGLRRSLALIPAEAAGYTISILTLGLALGPGWWRRRPCCWPGRCGRRWGPTSWCSPCGCGAAVGGFALLLLVAPLLR
jgi:hypothetical protein